MARDASSLRFVAPRQLTGYAGARRTRGRPPVRRCVPTDLSPIEQRQCVHLLTAGRSRATSLPNLLERLDEVFAGMEDIRLAVIGPPIEWWDVVDADGALGASCWQFGADAGVVYEPAGVTAIASYCQGALDLVGLLRGRTDGVAWWRALHAAHRAAAQRYPRSELATRDVAGEVSCPTCRTRLAIDDNDGAAGCRRCRPWVRALRATSA